MRDQRVNYVVVGGFVLLVLAGLVVTIALLAGRTGSVESYYTHFGNVIGLNVGTQVLYEGYKVGQIEGIELVEREGERVYRVEMSVRSDLRIAEGSTVYPTAPGFLSAMVLDIRGADAEATLPPGSEIEGVPAADVVAALSDVAGQFSQLTETTIAPMMEKLARSLPATAENLESLSGNAASLIGPDNVERVGSILRNLDATTEEAATLIAELGETRAAVDRVLTRLDGIVASSEEPIDQAVLDFQYSLESVARHIDAVNHNLEGMSRNMNEFSREIRQNPGVLLGGKARPDDATGGSDAP